MGKDCFCCSLSNLYCRPSTKAKTKQAKKILKNPKYKKLYWRAKRILAHKSTPEGKGYYLINWKNTYLRDGEKISWEDSWEPSVDDEGREMISPALLSEFWAGEAAKPIYIHQLRKSVHYNQRWLDRYCLCEEDIEKNFRRKLVNIARSRN